MNETIVCDTPDKILAYQLLSMRSALKLEILGLKHWRGSVANRVRYLMSVNTRNKKELLAIYETFLKDNGYIK